MKSPIIFNFDWNIIFIILQYLSLFFTRQYSFPIFIKEFILFISMIISLICFYKRNKFSYIDKNFNNERYFKTQLTINDQKYGNPKIKEYLYIILFYFMLNVIPFLNNIKLIRFFSIYSWCLNSIFIGIFVGNFGLNKFYIHQLLSVIILFFLMFCDPFFHSDNKKYKFHIFFFNLLFSLLYYYLQGLLRVYFKFSMEIKFVNPFFISAVDVGMNIIKNFLVIGYYYFLVDENRKQSYFNSNWYEKKKKMTLIYGIISIIGNVTYPIFNIMTCYIYSPYHQTICENYARLFDSILKNFNILNAFNGIINVFFSLVASEIIILKFCNLDKNTKIEIQKRAIKEEINNRMSVDSNLDIPMEEINENNNNNKK